ncbi:hypothetical protein AAY473_017430 [Plecturocebus cupreus]
MQIAAEEKRKHKEFEWKAQVRLHKSGMEWDKVGGMLWREEEKEGKENKKEGIFKDHPYQKGLCLNAYVVLLYSPGWSAVTRSRLTATSASWVQAILLPQLLSSWEVCRHIPLHLANFLYF